MEIPLHLITYASFLVFLTAVVARYLKIQNYPINLRWEIYPVPHEGKRAAYGGSRLEELNWWTKTHKASKATELKFMIPEMILLKGLWDHNRKLWYTSFPFHFGLYLVVAFLFLVLVGAILEVAGIAVGSGAGGFGAFLSAITVVVGGAGIILTLLGSLGLFYMRMTDSDMKPYTNFSHFFNLLFIVVALAVTLVAWVSVDGDFSMARNYMASLITFDLGVSAGSTAHSVAILLLSLLVAYIPLTHMSHFFVKWFTWHKIRWDDEPNVKGGRIETMIEKALESPVSWSATHIRADGKKNWVDIATEEIEK